MADVDPSKTEQAAEALNIKQQVDDATAFRQALTNILLESVKTHHAVMSSLSAAVGSNQDLRDKLALKWLEIGPEQAASIVPLLQQALKGAQSSQPETGGKPPST